MQLGHQARDKTYYLISNRSVLILLEFARRYCRANDSLEVDDEYLRRIGDCILIANDLASEATTFEYSPDTSMPKETRDREFRRTYARFSTREFLFNNTDQYRYALARSILIYDLLNLTWPA